MKIQRKNSNPQSVSHMDIPVGELFNGTIGDYTNEIFLMAYDHRVILMSNPEKTWTLTNLRVDDYYPVRGTLVIE